MKPRTTHFTFESEHHLDVRIAQFLQQNQGRQQPDAESAHSKAHSPSRLLLATAKFQGFLASPNPWPLLRLRLVVLDLLVGILHAHHPRHRWPQGQHSSPRHSGERFGTRRWKCDTTIFTLPHPFVSTRNQFNASDAENVLSENAGLINRPKHTATATPQRENNSCLSLSESPLHTSLTWTNLSPLFSQLSKDRNASKLDVSQGSYPIFTPTL